MATDIFFEEYNQTVKSKQRRKYTNVHEMISPGEASVIKQASAIEARRHLAESSVQPPVKLKEGATAPLQRKAPLNLTYELMEQGGHIRPDRLTDWEKANFEKVFKSMDDFGSINPHHSQDEVREGGESAEDVGCDGEG